MSFDANENNNSEPLILDKEDENENNIEKKGTIEDNKSNNSPSLKKNIKINQEQKQDNKNKQPVSNLISTDTKKETKNEGDQQFIKHTSTYNRPFMQKFMNKILSLDDEKKAKSKKKKYYDEDFFLFNKKNNKRKKKRKTYENIDNLISNAESTSFNMNSSNVKQKKKSIIRNILDLHTENEWNEFIDEYKKKYKEKGSIKNQLKLLFNINSDFMVIWKFVFSLFYMVILFMFFFKYVFLELPNLKDDETPKKRIMYLYMIINIMFLFDLILTIFVIMTNGGSLVTFLKLPLKIYTIIPFPLKASYIPLLIPKFCRIDLFRRVFNSIEHFILTNITHYVQNYYLKNFMTYTNRMFTYLLKFGLYAHFTCCIFSYLDGIRYVSALYYTIETFTTIGFGENSPQTPNSLFIGIINLFIGINLFTVITCNVNYIMSKIYAFNRETSFKQQFEFLIFQMQSSTGKVFPPHLKQLMSFSILFRRGLSYKDIKTQHEDVLKVCRNKMINEVQKTLLCFLRREYSLCFPKCEKDFLNSLLEVLKPKAYKTNKVIVNYGEKVNYLYFLISGELFAYNKYGKPIFTIFNSTLFCEYEFITGTTSNFTYKVHPNFPAYGFVICREDWENISKKDIISAKNFISIAYKKRNTYLHWLDKSYQNNLSHYEVSENNKIEDNSNNIICTDSNNINIEVNNLNRKYSKSKDNNNLVPVKTKNEKYQLDKIEIIKKINDFNKDLHHLEISMIEYKRNLLDYMQQ